MSAERRAAELGLDIPDYTDPPYGGRYGRMKAFHRVGDFVELSGITPESRDGVRLNPGSVGLDLSVDEGYAAARLTAINALGLIRYALGSLDHVVALSRALCFVVCPAGFEDLHLVSNGANDVFLDVFGPERGAAGRASIGSTSLSRGNCFELWLSLEASPDRS